MRENETLHHDWPDQLPDGALAIAENGGGDYLILESECDQVAFWDHETGVSSVVDVNWR